MTDKKNIPLKEDTPPAPPPTPDKTDFSEDINEGGVIPKPNTDDPERTED